MMLGTLSMTILYHFQVKGDLMIPFTEMIQNGMTGTNVPVCVARVPYKVRLRISYLKHTHRSECTGWNL
jgi:hypothetical protein